MSYEKGDPIVRFTDGNWNPASSCFFTEKQCHTYHKLPPKDSKAERIKVAERLEAVTCSLRRG